MGSLLLASLLWSLSFGLIKETLAGYDPRAVAAARLALAALAFSPWLRRAAPTGGERVRLMALGAVQFGLMYVLYIASYATLPASAVALFTVLTPLYVLGLEDLLARRLSRRGVVAAVAAAAGCAWMVWRGLPGREALAGVLLLQGANLSFAVGQVLYRRMRRGSEGRALDAGSLAWMYLGAAVLAGAAAAGGGAFGRGFDARAVGALLYLGLLPTGLGFWLWNRGAVRVSGAVAAVMNNVKIPLAVLAAWAVFGETVDLGRFLPGAILLFGAVTWLSLRDSMSD